MGEPLIDGKPVSQWVRDIVESCEGQHLVIEMAKKYGFPCEITCTCEV